MTSCCFGIRQALWIPHAGYVLAVQRLTALLGSYFCLALAPAVYNLTALTLSACCLRVFRAARFSRGCPFRSASLCGLLSVRNCAGQRRTDRYHQRRFSGSCNSLAFCSWSDVGSRKASPRGLGGFSGACWRCYLALSCPLLVLAVPAGVMAAVAAQREWCKAWPCWRV